MLFRKKPIRVEAVQWFPPGDARWPGKIEGVEIVVAGKHYPGKRPGEFLWADVHTMNGPVRINIGEWIITGVNGEKYPCDPEVFDKTYEPVEDVPL